MLRTGPFEFAVGATLIVAAAFFLVVTGLSIALGNERLDLALGPVVLYRFVHAPGITLVHVGPVVFLVAILAGASQAIIARRP